MEDMMKMARIAFILLMVSGAVWAELPARNAAPVLEGDPREAFLQGAEFVPLFDPVTGARDGSLRGYAMAVPSGLYVALLSSEPMGAKLVLPAAGASGSDLLLGEWMAVKVLLDGGGSRLFVQLPDSRSVVLDQAGRIAPMPEPIRWSAGKVFGFTWAGEWLLPWGTLGLSPDAEFHLEILRGRKRISKSATLEVLSRATPGTGASRWGGDGIPAAAPASFPVDKAGLRALDAFEVRPFVPEGDYRNACESSVPAGQVATAWLEWRGEGTDLKLEAVLPLNAKKTGKTGADPIFKWGTVPIFRLGFWWQAGRRVEMDAFFPTHVAAGEGDVFVAERLFPQDGRAECAEGESLRYVVTWRVPKDVQPGVVTFALVMTRGDEAVSKIPWRIRVTEALPEPSFVAGIYYLTKDQSRWEDDLKDIADHGFTAVTCPVADQAGWERFKVLARKHGLDGRFALNSDKLAPESGDWAYVWDEPSSLAALAGAEARAAALKAKGWRTWAALCWEPLGRLPQLLDACAYAPNLLDGAGTAKPEGAYWTYIQGLRENPAYNRGWMGREAREKGLSGVWVFCYRPEPEGSGDDWREPPIRYDSCVAPGPGGRSLSTVPWEALRQGILEGRLLRAGRPVS